MYESYYKLNDDPFRMRPECRYAFTHQGYARARSYLEYGLLRAEGVLVISGVPGTGKSTLVDDVLTARNDIRLQVARMLTTQADATDFLRMMAFAFGLEPAGQDPTSSRIAIQAYLQLQFERGNNVLLIIDEAQNLSSASLEQLRLLTNIQGEESGGLQVFLLGQQALRSMVLEADMEQFRQRVIAFCHLEPLNLAETRGYVRHRLRQAGWSGDPAFSTRAMSLVHHFSGGIPRRINLLLSRLLLSGFADDRHRLDANDVRRVVRQLSPEMVEAAILLRQPADYRNYRSGSLQYGDSNDTDRCAVPAAAIEVAPEMRPAIPARIPAFDDVGTEQEISTALAAGEGQATSTRAEFRARSPASARPRPMRRGMQAPNGSRMLSTQKRLPTTADR